MPRPSRARVVFVALALGTLGLGLLVHSSARELPGGVRDKLGDGLWAAMVVWWLGALAPRAPVWSRSLAALAFCWTVEASQLCHAPWLEAARRTRLGPLVLGSGFDVGDLGAYALGVLAPALGETIVRRRRPSGPPACVAGPGGSPSSVMRRGDYGYDAPYGLVMFGGLAVASALVATVFWRQGLKREAARMTFFSAFFLANGASFLHTTRRGKFLEWERILDRLPLRGDERVLDMGCGRGAVLTAVARRLTTGRVTGVDIWSTKDQSGNARDVTLRNAALEGVGERVEIETGDMRALPFPDATFDLVVSSLAIHNIPSNADRRRAVAEGFRVLKPGGRMVIADIRATRLYAEALRTLGATNVERRRLGWRFWWGNPIAGTTLLTASRAPAAR